MDLLWKRRVLVAVLVASGVSAVLASRVCMEFQPMRVKLLTSTPIDPTNQIATVDVDAGLSAAPDVPFALIARIENHSPEIQRLTIRVDGKDACVRSVLNDAISRVDCSWEGPWSRASAHQVQVVGSDMPWRLIDLEIATHHNATRGYGLLVVPGTRDNHVRPSKIAVAGVFVLVLGLFLLPVPAMGTVLSAGYHVVTGLLAACSIITLVSPFLSSFLVILSVGLFFKCVAVVAVPRVWQGARLAWS